MEDSCNHKNGASPRMEKQPGEKFGIKIDQNRDGSLSTLDHDEGLVLDEEFGSILGLAMVDKHPREEFGMNIIHHNRDMALGTLAMADKHPGEEFGTNIIDHNQDGSLSTIYSTIYRVPPEILSSDIGNANKHFYRPKAVCIGPYFYSIREDQGKSMQDHKRVCVNKLASKYGRTEEDFFNECLMTMKQLEGRVKTSYSEDISWLASEELARMLVLDGCFILNLLLKQRDNSTEEETDGDHNMKVIGRLWIWELVRYDLLLLENQIPFFVIQELYNILNPWDDGGINLVECALRYFKKLDPWKKKRSAVSGSALPPDAVHHLLHLTYKSFLPCPDWVNFSGPKSPQWIPSATELQAAGVKFQKKKNPSSFLDITFNKGVMEIPHLEVHDYSESLFRNLIAFEQSYLHNDFVVTAYATFMNCLVDTQNDLRLLHLKGILTFRMTGDKDTVHFFSRLCDDVHYPADRNYLDGVFRDVTAYKDLRIHKWRAELCLKYFSSPWSGIVVVAATLTFLLTLIQAFFTVFSYFWPPK